jgi:hypothetical protein
MLPVHHGVDMLSLKTGKLSLQALQLELRVWFI